MAINNGIDELIFNDIEKSIRETPFYNLLSIELAELGSGEAVFKVTPTEKHTNPMGIVHGGLLMSIADAAMGNAIRSLGNLGVTIDMSTSFISLAPINQEIIAKGQVLRSGKNLHFVEAKVFAEDKLLLHCKGTFFNVAGMVK
ncbi:MAG TPA: PaaI family thioesterase [Syntrophomonadaceae bacterium]|nr:PaaI family thioesterase [Syntrophomonadaceae bacterium]